jgi:catechol 2,3-dioxygenase-like lactoylglutathione lyase family enzyme
VIPEPPSHLGIVVPDLRDAIAKLAGLGHWVATPPVPFEVSTGPSSERTPITGLRAAWAGFAGLYLELLEAIAGSAWAPRPRPYLHHVGYWVDNVGAASRRLTAEGLPLEIDFWDRPEGRQRFAYHSLGGLRLEVGDSARRKSISALVRADPQISKLGSPSHIGVVVPDLDLAVMALNGLGAGTWLRMEPVHSGALRLGALKEPQPVASGWKAWSTFGALDLELLEAGGSARESQPEPYLHHIGYPVSDLAAASNQLARLGLPLEMTVWTDGGEPERVAYHAVDGLRIEAVNELRARQIKSALAKA